MGLANLEKKRTFLLFCRKPDEALADIDEELKSVLEIMLTNVNPNLACEIKDCWIDPDLFSIGNMIGRGKFVTTSVKSNCEAS